MSEWLQVELAKKSNLSSIDFKNLGFGRIFTDHMLECDYVNGKWEVPQIKPFHNLSLHPATNFIHYGQSIFEGLKAFKSKDNVIRVFRPDANYERMNRSAERLCMPPIPKQIFIDGIRELLKIDSAWFPDEEGTSMYIRPIMFSMDAEIRVKPSERYKFLIILSPSAAYYSAPVKVLVEQRYVRASNGGLGYAKTAANYAASLLPAKLAQEKGYDQIVWTDSKEHKFIEEAGTMNFMFVINDAIVTPELTDSILAGVTRDSILTLARDKGIKTIEKKVSIEEVIDAVEKGTLTEAFGTGTAATISQIITIGYNLRYNGKDYQLPDISYRVVSNSLAKELNDIKLGKLPDVRNWNMVFEI
jgi:branched-chain amino acid aminotransferase